MAFSANLKRPAGRECSLSHLMFSDPQPSGDSFLTSGPTFVTLRPWKRTFSASDSGPTPRRAKSDFLSVDAANYTAVARSVGKVFLAAPTMTLVTGGVDTELDRCQCRPSRREHALELAHERLLLKRRGVVDRRLRAHLDRDGRRRSCDAPIERGLGRIEWQIQKSILKEQMRIDGTSPCVHISSWNEEKTSCDNTYLQEMLGFNCFKSLIIQRGTLKVVAQRGRFARVKPISQRDEGASTTRLRTRRASQASARRSPSAAAQPTSRARRV